ncbi:MAG: UDP-N-acetylmuramoyl-tripeptide--D-alanyl-D-alanine ligase [Clostridia bacterium]|nr:UDP-N-acetylmuramoyl-tripeptide--D-alanyl-D-alanine ligase [Clostridia bacterium]
MKNFTVRDAVNAIGGRYFGTEEQLSRIITGASSDSRTVGEGTIFVCYRGARVDGHDFMADCLKKGAACCIAEREPKDESEMPCIVAETSLAGVARLAGWYRRQFDVPVVGITGSVDKTTAKEMIWAVLNQKYKTHKNRMNFNNEISLPLMILEMPEDAGSAILEMGISDFGEMTRLAAMVRPDIAVITNIGDAHLEFLGDRSGVLKAKTEVFDLMDADGLAILNGDDEYLRGYKAPVKTITFGMGDHNDFYARDVENLAGDGVRLTICHHGREFPAQIPAFGLHMVYAALMGAAVGYALGLTDEEIARGIANYETVGNRAKLIPANGFTIMSDCYNANPNSTASALESLCTLKGRRVCILGDMLELGPDTLKLHARTGAKAVSAGCDLVIGCGELSRATYEGAVNAGGSALYFAEKAELIEKLPEIIRKGDNVLVKASHSKAFETVVEALEKL